MFSSLKTKLLSLKAEVSDGLKSAIKIQMPVNNQSVSQSSSTASDGTRPVLRNADESCSETITYPEVQDLINRNVNKMQIFDKEVNSVKSKIVKSEKVFDGVDCSLKSLPDLANLIRELSDQIADLNEQGILFEDQMKVLSSLCERIDDENKAIDKLKQLQAQRIKEEEEKIAKQALAEAEQRRKQEVLHSFYQKAFDEDMARYRQHIELKRAQEELSKITLEPTKDDNYDLERFLGDDHSSNIPNEDSIDTNTVSRERSETVGSLEHSGNSLEWDANGDNLDFIESD